MPNGKPNILVIWGDDIGYWNISAYSRGMMGYQTPNIDRIANEGMLFTDCYGEQSCTAGRSAFITGQSVFRTGLSKVGLPGADRSCTSTLRIIRSARESGKIALFHDRARGLCHDSTAIFVPTGGLGTPVVVCDAVLRLA
jgi:hypothetical protein